MSYRGDVKDLGLCTDCGADGYHAHLEEDEFGIEVERGGLRVAYEHCHACEGVVESDCHSRGGHYAYKPGDGIDCRPWQIR